VVGKPPGKKCLKRKWDVNIKMGLRKIGHEDVMLRVA
jgi:hypothetical protein